MILQLDSEDLELTRPGHYPSDYKQVVTDSHFPQGFLAPKHVTPENQKAIQDIYVTDGHDLDTLLEISLNRFDEHSWDPTAFATCTFGMSLPSLYCPIA